AAAVYVQAFATETFVCDALSGLEAEGWANTLLEGEGFSGKVVADKTPASLTSELYPALRPRTSSLENIPIRVFLYPLVHYGSCVGLIELAVHDDGTPNEEYAAFLARASRNIA